MIVDNATQANSGKNATKVKSKLFCVTILSWINSVAVHEILLGTCLGKHRAHNEQDIISNSNKNIVKKIHCKDTEYNSWLQREWSRSVCVILSCTQTTQKMALKTAHTHRERETLDTLTYRQLLNHTWWIYTGTSTRMCVVLSITHKLRMLQHQKTEPQHDHCTVTEVNFYWKWRHALHWWWSDRVGAKSWACLISSGFNNLEIAPILHVSCAGTSWSYLRWCSPA